MTEARLVTPQGQTIKLTVEDYREIMALLQRRRAAFPADQLEATVNETHGKYAGGPPLTQALLQARREDQELEEARLRQGAKRQGT